LRQVAAGGAALGVLQPATVIATTPMMKNLRMVRFLVI